MQSTQMAYIEYMAATIVAMYYHTDNVLNGQLE
jgi:hypothetical protein